MVCFRCTQHDSGLINVGGEQMRQRTVIQFFHLVKFFHSVMFFHSVKFSQVLLIPPQGKTVCVPLKLSLEFCIVRIDVPVLSFSQVVPECA